MEKGISPKEVSIGQAHAKENNASGNPAIKRFDDSPCVQTCEHKNHGERKTQSSPHPPTDARSPTITTPVARVMRSLRLKILVAVEAPEGDAVRTRSPEMITALSTGKRTREVSVNDGHHRTLIPKGDCR